MEIAQGKNLLSNIKEKLIYHLVDTTAILTVTNPLFVPMEVGVSGMSDAVSINSRLTIAALSYGGLGWVYSKGRDWSRKFFHITDTTKEKIQTLHDSIYTLGINLAIMPPIYLSMGADLKQAAIGSASAAVMGIVTGPLMGYSIDVARDLTGLQECNRTSYPKIIKKQKSSFKKGLAGLLVVGSIAAMAGTYALTNDKPEPVRYNNPQTIEHLVSQ